MSDLIYPTLTELVESNKTLFKNPIENLTFLAPTKKEAKKANKRKTTHAPKQNSEYAPLPTPAARSSNPIPTSFGEPDVSTNSRGQTKRPKSSRSSKTSKSSKPVVSAASKKSVGSDEHVPTEYLGLPEPPQNHATARSQTQSEYMTTRSQHSTARSRQHNTARSTMGVPRTSSAALANQTDGQNYIVIPEGGSKPASYRPFPDDEGSESSPDEEDYVPIPGSMGGNDYGMSNTNRQVPQYGSFPGEQNGATLTNTTNQRPPSRSYNTNPRPNNDRPPSTYGDFSEGASNERPPNTYGGFPEHGSHEGAPPTYGGFPEHGSHEGSPSTYGGFPEHGSNNGSPSTYGGFPEHASNNGQGRPFGGSYGDESSRKSSKPDVSTYGVFPDGSNTSDDDDYSAIPTKSIQHPNTNRQMVGSKPNRSGPPGAPSYGQLPGELFDGSDSEEYKPIPIDNNTNNGTRRAPPVTDQVSYQPFPGNNNEEDSDDSQGDYVDIPVRPSVNRANSSSSHRTLTPARAKYAPAQYGSFPSPEEEYADLPTRDGGPLDTEPEEYTVLPLKKSKARGNKVINPSGLSYGFPPPSHTKKQQPAYSNFPGSANGNQNGHGNGRASAGVPKYNNLPGTEETSNGGSSGKKKKKKVPAYSSFPGQ
eukprot:CAMPEP_0168534066 /NCGR_PEP_ID=MMETSP0405-20121227/17591_1 /TAXON_ID=498012 /ORGANISM="Trichosphaerium sp, Strain Am-I-7 wt" /LENGTH=645 /DNA_ID=CAMNT_0008560527 /DNA_START=430 /DNA_END=2367 /DNA_ORIENTATION=+